MCSKTFFADVAPEQAGASKGSWGGEKGSSQIQASKSKKEPSPCKELEVLPVLAMGARKQREMRPESTREQFCALERWKNRKRMGKGRHRLA